MTDFVENHDYNKKNIKTSCICYTSPVFHNIINNNNILCNALYRAFFHFIFVATSILIPVI